MRFLSRLILALVLVLVTRAGITGAVDFPNPLHLFGGGKSGATPAPTPGQSAPARVAGVPLSFADIARLGKPAVVNVSTTQTVRQGGPELGQGPSPFGERDPFSEFFRHFGQVPRNFTQRSLGSGFIIDRDGDVVTNAHVVKNADKIVVKLENQREIDAKVVGIDEKTDVALLKIPAGDYPVVTLGNSDAIQVGDWVLAIGNPFGLSETVTAGIVSAKGRVIGEGPYDDFIQTDASINPGNSGGPLLDVHGEVIGINAAIFSQSGGNIGIGFAIPINLARGVVEQLKTHGKVVRGWLGVSIQEVTPDLAHSFGLAKSEGALVADVTPDSPAARAGVERGDIIIEYQGTHIDTAHQLPALVAATEIGKTVSITVLRNGAKKTVKATVAEMPSNVTAESGPAGDEDWGLAVADITADVARQLDLKERTGVVVTDVDSNSPADDAGVQPGDVITQVNREPVRNVLEYRKALAAAGDAHELLLLVRRQGQSLFVALHRS